MNETIKNINKRYSVRSFSDTPVADDDIKQIALAGMAAPVGLRRYDTLHLTVVKNKAYFDEITTRAGMKTAERPTAPLYKAPALIVVSTKFERTDHIEYANVGCVMENMAIAATSLGIDNIYLWGFLRVVRENPDLLAKLNLPEGFSPISALAIGYAEDPIPQDGSSPRHSIDIDYIN